MTNGIPCPCKDCGERHRACHDSCTKYAIYKLEMERKRAWERKHSYRDADVEYQLRKNGAVWTDRALNARSGRKGGKVG